MKKLIVLISIVFVSNLGVAGQYNGPILTLKVGALDHTDGIANTCNIYANHPDIEDDIDIILDHIADASYAKIWHRKHIWATIPSIQIYATKVVRNNVDDETGKIRLKKVLLRLSYGSTQIRAGKAAIDLRNIVQELCSE